MKAVTSFKFHTNSWGLGACKWFAENIVSKMVNLQKIDLSDTIHFKHRTDLTMSSGNILDAAVDKQIIRINFADNDLEEDGAKAFVRFLEKNTTLRVLNLHNCNLDAKSFEMM